MSELAQKNQIVPFDHEALIMKAVESQVPVETMERLLAMRKDLKEEQAREAYFAAMSAFQRKCPIIKKTREIKVNGTVRSRYATLDDIVGQVKDLLAEQGLSYSFKTIHAVEDRGEIIISCIVSHVMGHVGEPSNVAIPIEKEAYMNDAQKSGSAQTYAKRYAFCNAFGIMTGDEDDDGNALGRGQTPQDLYKKFSYHMKAVMENVDTVTAVKHALSEDDLESAAEAMAEIDDANTLSALFLAPSKGGCFTSEEKKKMGSPEYKEFYGKHREGREMEGL